MTGVEYLKEKGVSQSMLARKMKMTRQNVNLWFKGVNAPSAGSIEKISHALTELTGEQVTEAEVYLMLQESRKAKAE